MPEYTNHDLPSSKQPFIEFHTVPDSNLNSAGNMPMSALWYKTRVSLMVALALFGFGLLASCDRNSNTSSDPIDDQTIVAVPPEEKNVNGVDVVVLDQNGDAIPDASVLVIDDELNGNVVDDEHELVVVDDGFVRLPLNSFSDTAVLRLEAEKAGYFSNGGRYELIAGEDLVVEIVLTSEDTDTAGIRIVEADGDSSQGSLSASATAVEDPEEVLTSVTIPQDLVILDVDGNTLDNNLHMSVVHYDSRDDQALRAFPGGFDVTIENIDSVDTAAIEGTVPSGSTESVDSRVIFQSAGFTAIEIFDSQGRKADKFVGEIDVTMAIPPGTLNPQTRQPITVGDIIPVWSFDTDTARWVYEGKEAVQRNARGGLQVTYKADHLSYWNLDFFTSSACDPVIDVAVESSDGFPVVDSPIRVVIRGADANVGFYRSRTLSSGQIILLSVPATFPVSVNFSSAIAGVGISRITRNGAAYAGQPFDLCSGSAFGVVTDTPLNDIEESLSIDYNVNAVAQCSNSPGTAPVPLENVSVTYYPSNYSYASQARTNALGNATVTARGTPNGRVNAYYNGQQQKRYVSGPSSRIDFAFSTECVITTGSSGQ